MGYAKQTMIEAQDRGWTSLDRMVCADCLSDEDLKEIVRSHSEDAPCSYCGKSPSAPFDGLMEAINAGVRTEWQDANSAGLFWDSEEGGWQGVDVTDTYDLFHYEIDAVENEKLRQDVINSTMFRSRSVAIRGSVGKRVCPRSDRSACRPVVREPLSSFGMKLPPFWRLAARQCLPRKGGAATSDSQSKLPTYCMLTQC
jgi:hypothetical protein